MPALQRRRGPMHDINIVPYVDVMLVLLVIFMVTAPLVTPAIIDLPTVDKASQPRVVPIEIFVRADQGLRISQRDASGQIVDERDVTKSELANRSEEHTSELQSRLHLVCRLLLEKKKKDATRESRELADVQ